MTSSYVDLCINVESLRLNWRGRWSKIYPIVHVPLRKCLVLQLESVICVEQIRRVPSSYYMRSKHMKGNLNITCGAHLSDWQYRFLVKHLEFQPWESVIHRAIIIVRILTIHAYKIEIHWISITFCIFKVLVSHLSFFLHV